MIITQPAPSFKTGRVLQQPTYFCKNCAVWYLTLGSTWNHYYWEVSDGWAWLNE